MPASKHEDYRFAQAALSMWGGPARLWFACTSQRLTLGIQCGDVEVMVKPLESGIWGEGVSGQGGIAFEKDQGNSKGTPVIVGGYRNRKPGSCGFFFFQLSAHLSGHAISKAWVPSTAVLFPLPRPPPGLQKRSTRRPDPILDFQPKTMSHKLFSLKSTKPRVSVVATEDGVGHSQFPKMVEAPAGV